MQSYEWTPGVDVAHQLEALLAAADSPGYLVVSFEDGSGGAAGSWDAMQRWTRSRAVTVADVRGAVRGGALDVAVCCDLVLARDRARLELPPTSERPSRPLLWALARAGRAALAHGLLDGLPLTARQAVELGVAHRVVEHDAALPLPDGLSAAALTAARDLLRSRSAGGAGRALELATFRLLFATGDPEEGARSFLERRAARFGGVSGTKDGGGHGDGRSGH